MSDIINNEILLNIAKDIAVNTEATKNIEKHLALLNSKVALQESIGNTLKISQELLTRTVDGMVDRERRKTDNQNKLTWLTIENIFKLIFGFAITYLLWKAGIK